MNFLVTGANGFIGKAVCSELERQFPLSCIFKFELRDINESPDWRVTLETQVKHCECIFHIGAISSTDASDVNRVMFLNYEFTKILIDFAKKYGKFLIYSSSAATYGKGDNIPSTLYAWTKKAAEDYGMATLAGFISLRYFNVYGPGEEHKGHMASVAYQAYTQWNRCRTPFLLLPGNPRRDFVYIKDIVNANIFAYVNRRDLFHDIYDVGTGFAEPFEAVLEFLDIPYTYKDASAVPSWYQYFTQADRDKFMSGWTPEYDLSIGMKDYISFLRQGFI